MKSFSEISKPLVDLANSSSFYWNEDLNQYFITLRSPGKVTVSFSTSSLTGSDQVLSQIQDRHQKIIAFSGSQYNRQQRNWTIYELEVCSLMQGLRRFYEFLSGEEFTWRCDCKVL